MSPLRGSSEHGGGTPRLPRATPDRVSSRAAGKWSRISSTALSVLSSPSRRVVSAGAGILICALLAWGLPRAVNKMLNDYPWDGFVDWTSAQSFWANENPYDAAVMARHDTARFGGVGHPPTTAFWFLPFATLSLNGMSTALGIIVLGMLFVQLLIICRELALPRPLLFASTWYALTVPTPWFFWHVSLAQVSVPIAFFVVIAWYFLRHGKDVWAGASLGLAASFKLFPGVLMLFLLATGRVRAFAASAIAFGAIAAIMTARFGFDAWFMFFEQQGDIGRQWIGHVRNRSFHGIVLRLVTPEAPSTVPASFKVSVVVSVISVMSLALALYFVRRRGREPVTFDLSFALLCCLSVFFNVWVWEHYYALLLLPGAIVAVACVRADQLGMSRVARPIMMVLLFLLFIDVETTDVGRLVTLSSRIPNLTPLQHVELHLRELTNALPWPSFAALCFGLLLWFDRKDRRSTRSGWTSSAGAS